MIRILVVDDQNLVREGIKILLEKATDINIVGEAKNGNEALQKIETLQPDVVLLDVEMPGVDGLAVADKISVQFPKIKVIMLSSHEDSSYVEKATNHGAKGYLLKNVSSHELEWSVRLVDSGYSAIKSELLEQQLEKDVKRQPEPVPSRIRNYSAVNTVETSKPVPVATMSSKERKNLNQLERLLVDNQLKPQNLNHQRARRKKKKILHNVKVTQIKKTVLSFEFKLLILIILFSLGFLTFVALS